MKSKAPNILKNKQEKEVFMACINMDNIQIKLKVGVLNSQKNSIGFNYIRIINSFNNFISLE